jgi:hypothetical protein
MEDQEYPTYFAQQQHRMLTSELEKRLLKEAA